MLLVHRNGKPDGEAIDVVAQQGHLRAVVQQARDRAAGELICRGRGRVGVHDDVELVAVLAHAERMRAICVNKRASTWSVAEINGDSARGLLTIGEVRQVGEAGQEFVTLVQQIVRLLAACGCALDLDVQQSQLTGEPIHRSERRIQPGANGAKAVGNGGCRLRENASDLLA